MIAKDEREHPIPVEWRPIIEQVIVAFVAGDYELRRHTIAGVSPVSPAAAASIADNISGYGEGLAPLHPAVWDRSVCRWAGDGWDMVIDLTTNQQQVSDLALHAKRIDSEPGRLAVGLVYVP